MKKNCLDEFNNTIIIGNVLSANFARKIAIFGGSIKTLERKHDKVLLLLVKVVIPSNVMIILNDQP